MTRARDGGESDARLDARLATFTRYAATVSEEFGAALRGDAVRAEALAEERALLGEHFAELRAAPPAGDAGARSFDAMLAGAIEELDHQMGVELALRQRLATLRDEALRVLHEPPAAGRAEQGGAPHAGAPHAGAPHAARAAAARTAAALAALDPAAVSGVMLASLAAPGEPAAPEGPVGPVGPEGPRAAPGRRPEPGGRRLDVRF